MLLPETKEREYRFKLALRIGLPIFALILAFISDTLISTYENLQMSFYIEATMLLAFSIYFIFYIIYRGFDVKISEPITKTFTRDYLYKYLLQDIKKEKEYTLILISIDNLHDINTRYGIKNGDKVLFEVVKYIGAYFKDKNLYNFPIGHIKGADFVLGFKGKKENFNVDLELFFLKSSEFVVDDIEVNISGAITDTSFSNNLEYMIENLFEIQEENKTKKIVLQNDEMNPSDLELYVIDAMRSKSITIMTQSIYENQVEVIKECFVKLINSDGKILHPKKYMKVLNKLGLTPEYDFLVLQKSVFDFSGDGLTNFAITISPTSLRNHNFLTKVKNLINDNPHAKDKIIFILSETHYYSDIERYNSILQSLRILGIKIAIDRVGSLHSSFLYLRDLDIDIIRFDTFYIKKIKNKKYNSIIHGLNVMAHSRGIKTWIRMVENKDIKEFATMMKIDYIQGKELAKLININED